jgi:hypothetical protein
LNIRFLIHLICFALILSSCQNGQEATSKGAMPLDNSPVGQAVKDLAQRLGVQPDEIELIGEKKVSWSDGSLGCPKPGMMYTQALVDGLQILLRVDGVDYAYHSGRGKPPFYCENPVSPAGGSSVE